MRSKSILLIVAAALAIVAVVFAVKERSARREAERALDRGRTQRVRLETDIHQAEQQLAELEGEQQRVRAALDAARKKIAAVSIAPAAAQGRPSFSPAAAVRDALLHDPHFQNLQLAAMQSKFLGTYRPLCEQLNLTPAQTEQFLGILRKRSEQQLDLTAIAETQRPAADDPVFAKLKQQMADDFRTAQTALLGDSGYRQLETYERAVPAWELVNEIVGATSVAGIGLTSGQADALVKTMTEASPAYQRGSAATPKTIDWDRVLAGAAATLSPPQLALLKNAVTQFHNMDRLRELAQSPSKPGGG